MKPVDKLRPNDEYDLTTASLSALNFRLKVIYERDDFDSPAMLAERRAICQEVYRCKYADVRMHR